MTVRELGERMDAPELMEWLAYYKLKDEKEMERLNLELQQEKSDAERAESLRNFFMALTPNATTSI